MNKQLKNVLTILCFIALIAFLASGYISNNNKKVKFKELSQQIENYKNTTIDRVAKVVISLPDDNNILVGMKDNIGNYKTPKPIKEGVAKIDNKFLKTYFVNGVYEKINPRLDAVAPMTISTDSLGGSTYIVLFNDRGDVALEKSYARIGGLDVIINSINTIAPSPELKDQEFKMVATYTLKGKQKKVMIPVVDGHFDPKNTVSK